MATAKKTTKKVTKTVKEKEQRIKLSLTLEEATTLYTITRSIGGSPTTTRRKYSDSIGYALKQFNLPDVTDSYDKNNRINSIWFKQ